jgi:hypothetical protein
VGVEARRERGSSILNCAEGKGSPREELDCCGKPARVNWEKLWRKAELEKVRAWISADSKFGTADGRPQSRGNGRTAEWFR